MTNPTNKLATIRIDHDDYIELQFVETSHKAVDDLIDHLINIVNSAGNDDRLRIYVNSGMISRGQPIPYLLGKLRQNRKHFNISIQTRIAVTFNLMPLAGLLEMFVRSLYTGKIIFKPFSVHDEVRALEWLTSK